MATGTASDCCRPGGSADPMVLFRGFRGRELRIEPLLGRHGLQTESKQ